MPGFFEHIQSLIQDLTEYEEDNRFHEPCSEEEAETLKARIREKIESKTVEQED